VRVDVDQPRRDVKACGVDDLPGSGGCDVGGDQGDLVSGDRNIHHRVD
jgi:hypothetical protein